MKHIDSLSHYELHVEGGSGKRYDNNWIVQFEKKGLVSKIMHLNQEPMFSTLNRGFCIVPIIQDVPEVIVGKMDFYESKHWDLESDNETLTPFVSRRNDYLARNYDRAKIGESIKGKGFTGVNYFTSQDQREDNFIVHTYTTDTYREGNISYIQKYTFGGEVLVPDGIIKMHEIDKE